MQALAIPGLPGFALVSFGPAALSVGDRVRIRPGSPTEQAILQTFADADRLVRATWTIVSIDPLRIETPVGPPSVVALPAAGGDLRRTARLTPLAAGLGVLAVIGGLIYVSTRRL